MFLKYFLLCVNPPVPSKTRAPQDHTPPDSQQPRRDPPNRVAVRLWEELWQGGGCLWSWVLCDRHSTTDAAQHVDGFADVSSVRLRMPELASGSFETTRTHEFSMTSSRSDMAESGRGIQGAEGRREREGALHQKRRCISVHGGSSNRSGNPARSLFRSTSSFRSSHRSL